MAYTLDGTSLGHIQDETNTKTTGIIEFNGPEDDSDKTEAIDFMGPIRKFTIEGIIADTVANQQTFAAKFDGIANGSQNTTIVYVSDFYGSFNVKITEFESHRVAGDPLKLEYTIKIIQSA